MNTNKILYNIAGAYDFILGALFLGFSSQLFQLLDIVPPNHYGYIHFPALLLMIFGFMFFRIAKKPKQNKGLIIYGILLKISYCSVVFGHYVFDTIPSVWVIMGVCDFVFLLAFIWSYRTIAK